MALIIFMLRVIQKKMCENCEKQENCEKCVECTKAALPIIYDYANKALDFTRRIMYLENMNEVIATFLSLILIANLGKYLSTGIILIIAFNVYIILRYPGLQRKLIQNSKDLYNKLIQLVDKYIPKFDENAKNIINEMKDKVEKVIENDTVNQTQESDKTPVSESDMHAEN